jgi:hypothetical protein
VGDLTKADAGQKCNQFTARDESNGVSKQANGMSEHFLKKGCQTFRESFGSYFGFPVAQPLPD